MKTLIGMTDFVIKTHNEIYDSIDSESMMFNYANFLRQPLELWMLVPCDEDGNVLIHPFNKIYPASMSFSNEIEDYNLKFRQAKERCLFDGFEYIISNNPDVYGLLLYGNDTIYPDNFNTIEDVAKYKPKLTLTAIKQIGL